MSALPPESSAPRQIAGTRLRAGNAMGRTRAAVIDGAQRAVEKHGSRKATMADVAALAGVAKATLYNHFRTKRDVYAATIDAEVEALGAECARVATDEGLAAGLVRAAERLGMHPAVRRVAADEPAALARLQTPSSDPAWATARAAVASILTASRTSAGEAEVETVLRWLVSFLGAPGGNHELRRGAHVLASGLREPSGGPGWHGRVN
ncbi:MAG: TetR/AcrR family transcriptional regulator [Actinomycetes bacterium]